MTDKENVSTSPNCITSDSEKYYVYYNSPNFEYGGTLKNISTVTFQGMECIKGTAVSKWDEGRIVYIPIQHVHMLIEFDSLEDWEKAKKAQKKERKKRHYGVLGRLVNKF